MTIIATNTVRPHQGKTKLQLNNMLEVTKAFGDMGITEEFQALVSKAAEVGELHSGWITVPADY